MDYYYGYEASNLQEKEATQHPPRDSALKERLGVDDESRTPQTTSCISQQALCAHPSRMLSQVIALLRNNEKAKRSISGAAPSIMLGRLRRMLRRRLRVVARSQADYKDPLSIQRSSTQTQELAESFVLYEGEKIADELITRVRIGPEVTVIPDSAFLGYTNLTEVQLPEGLKVVGQCAFQYCKSLRSVTIPSTVAELGEGAFYSCSNLVELQLNEGLEIIEREAFQNCTALRSVTLPSTVTELDEGTFYDCSNLVNLQLNEGLEIIRDYAFKYCKSLRSVTLPSTVNELGQEAFFGCINLVDLQLNEGLKIIGMAAFYFSSALRSVTLPSTVTELGNGAFLDCRNLAELHLNEGLQVIGEDAFCNCMTLQSVTIPSTVTNLGRGAFNGCMSLSEVIVLGGERFMNRDFLVHGLFDEEQGLLNHRSINNFLIDGTGFGLYGRFAFHYCPLNTVKVSMFNVLSERMDRLPQECRRSVEERIRGLNRLEVTQDGNVLACFPVVRSNGNANVRDTNLETARSAYQFLRWIAFHELKESSILIELAMWKSKVDGSVSVLPREDCRVAIPGPAKTAIMEYCGFEGFLKPATDD
ncbi:hypothetical protein THAOC_31370 [Thalassiosira oceanica]|uniref:Leucine-rich repeat domain-containing protein n=1 Tax=Thalassiosira oceanica TaxID=159749 RepID=K0R9G1_THAOC|nr:hypothetical protein THAOC_31370 [Thalassiosira oceanica]|eukprot:EJK49720.1 hypothetical protein THAOC_31370 [Thalassiosira oceanica]